MRNHGFTPLNLIANETLYQLSYTPRAAASEYLRVLWPQVKSCVCEVNKLRGAPLKQDNQEL